MKNGTSKPGMHGGTRSTLPLARNEEIPSGFGLPFTVPEWLLNHLVSTVKLEIIETLGNDTDTINIRHWSR